jgi:polygalacturonase
MIKLALYAGLAAAFASSITALPATATSKTSAKTTLIKAASTTTKASSTAKAATACTFTNAASAIASKQACTSIVIDAIPVPAGTTLDLTGLNTGTTVTFQGNTSFGYEQWVGPLLSISGTNIHVIGAPGSVLDGLGSYYWDGQGSNGGKTKPKFFSAHSLVSSSITNVKIANAPVQIFSIDSATNLALTGITVDNSAGAALGHNTDAFDIGESTGVYISGANVINQDDCLAINSGTVSRLHTLLVACPIAKATC